MIAPIGFKDIIASLMRFTNETRDLIIASGICVPTFVHFDAHSDITKLPEGDLLGIGGFALEVEDHHMYIHASFGVSTTNDENLFRHYEMMDILFRRLIPGMKYPALDAGTAQEIGTIVVANGTTLHPMERTEVRNLQYVEALFLTDLSLTAA